MNLNETQTIELSAISSQKKIFSIEINLNCISPSNLMIELTDSIDNRQHMLRVKKGEIDQLFKFDWYTSQCNLSISCINKNDILPTSIDLEYRFLGIN